MNCPFLATEPLACLSSSGHIWGLFSISTSTDLTGYLSINGQLISQCLAILENCIFTLKECPRARAPWSWPCWVWDVNVSVGSRGINYSFCVTNPRIWTHSILRYQDNVECLSETLMLMWCFNSSTIRMTKYYFLQIYFLHLKILLRKNPLQQLEMQLHQLEPESRWKRKII